MRNVFYTGPSILFATMLTTGAMAESEQRSFDVSAGGRFVLDADWGRVEVETWDRDAVDVVVERTSELESLEFGEEQGTVTVRARKKERSVFRWLRSDDAPLFQVTRATALRPRSEDGRRQDRHRGHRRRHRGAYRRRQPGDRRSQGFGPRPDRGRFHPHRRIEGPRGRPDLGRHDPDRPRRCPGGCPNDRRIDPHRRCARVRFGTHDGGIHQARRCRWHARRENDGRFHPRHDRANNPRATPGCGQRGVASHWPWPTTSSWISTRGRRGAGLTRIYPTPLPTPHRSLPWWLPSTGGGPKLSLRTTGGSIRLSPR